MVREPSHHSQVPESCHGQLSFVSILRPRRQSTTRRRLGHRVQQSTSAQHALYSGRRLDIFFDRTEIRDGQDWQSRIYQGLRTSSLFIAFLSPTYLESEWCRREWEEYLRLEHTLARGDGGITQIYFVARENMAEHPAFRTWLADFDRRQITFNLSRWFNDGANRLRELDAIERLEELRVHPRSDDDRSLLALADEIVQLTGRFPNV